MTSARDTPPVLCRKDGATSTSTGMSNNATESVEDHPQKAKRLFRQALLREEVHTKARPVRHLAGRRQHKLLKAATVDGKLLTTRVRAVNTIEGVTSVLPPYSQEDIRELQAADPTIKVFLHYWTESKRPSPRVVARQSKQVKTMLAQWDRMEM